MAQRAEDVALPVEVRSNCRLGRMHKLTEGVLCVLAFSLAIAWPVCPVLAETRSSADDVMRETQVLVVTSPADSGPGSLRTALEQASKSSQTSRIGFGSAEGPFSVPQVIELESPLPVIETEVEVDGFIPGLLWKAYGATVSGNDRFRVFEVAPGGALRLAGITVANGHADLGAGVLNRGVHQTWKRSRVRRIVRHIRRDDDVRGRIYDGVGVVAVVESSSGVLHDSTL